MKKNQTELISPELFENAVLNRNGALGDVACQVMATAIRAVNAYQCVRDNVWVKGDRAQFGNSDVDLNKFTGFSLSGLEKHLPKWQRLYLISSEIGSILQK